MEWKIEAATHAKAAAKMASTRPNTRPAHEGGWGRFCNWCQENGVESLPATPHTVATYLAFECKPSTVWVAKAAISSAHQDAGFQAPSGKAVHHLLKLLAPPHLARAGRVQSIGLTADRLDAIHATATIPRTGPTGRTESGKAAKRRGAVDVALITTMREGMLRRSEAAALRWRDLDFHPDGSVSATLLCSKADSGEAIVALGPDPARLLQAIRPEDAEPDAPVFGLKSERSISNRIAAAAKAAGIGERFSDRFLSIGMLQDLKASVQITSHKPRITTKAAALTRAAAALMSTAASTETETREAAALARAAAALVRTAASFETAAAPAIAALTPLGEEANIEKEEREAVALGREAAALTRAAAALTRTASTETETRGPPL